MDFKDKVIIITGASSGIGAATAIYLSKLSAKLVLIGRNEKNLKKIALYCEKAKGVKPLPIIADVTNESDLERILKETIDEFGQLDVLVNNAGVTAMGGIKKTDMESFDKIMSVNTRAVFQLTMLATPHLISSKGCIINISSILSTRPSTMMLAYNMSKAAIDQFTKCVALELAPDGVRVNAVNPGFVRTNIINNSGLTEEQIDMFAMNMGQSNPLKKLVEASEVASLVAFLASDQAKSITGCCYPIDSGRMLV